MQSFIEPFGHNTSTLQTGQTTVRQHGANCFWVTICKTVCPMLSECCPICPVCLSVCNVGVLWPNGWMDQHETWHGGRLRPQSHCVRCEPSSPPIKRGTPPIFGSSLLWPNDWMDQDATGYGGRPLGTKVDLGPGYVVLDGDPAPFPLQRGTPALVFSGDVCYGQTQEG